MESDFARKGIRNGLDNPSASRVLPLPSPKGEPILTCASSSWCCGKSEVFESKTLSYSESKPLLNPASSSWCCSKSEVFDYKTLSDSEYKQIFESKPLINPASSSWSEIFERHQPLFGSNTLSDPAFSRWRDKSEVSESKILSNPESHHFLTECELPEIHLICDSAIGKN